MSSQIHNLDRDSILMLYVAGELSGEDYSEVQAMLASDAGLRAEYEQLVVAESAMYESLSAADKTMPLAAPVQTSVRRVGAAIEQWHVEELKRKANAPLPIKRKYGWVYSAAAAAAIIVVGVFVLWSRVDDGKNDDQVAKLMEKMNKLDEGAKGSGDAASNKDSESNGNTQVAQATTPQEEPDDYTPSGGGNTEVMLTRAEVDLSTLSALTDSFRAIQETDTP